jgi:hypothetical protein
MKPFRWDIRRREQLGTLLGGERPATEPGFLQDLRRCAAKSVAAAGDAQLVFVGRSPESLFDYLSGVFLGHRWEDRLALVNLSLRTDVGAGDADTSTARSALRDHLTHHGLTPQRIASADRPIALIDIVDTGSTFRGLIEQWAVWAGLEGVDTAAVRRRLRIVGVTYRQKTSPNAFRWHQQPDNARWLNAFPRIRIKNVSAPYVFWEYLASQQPKVSPSHPPKRWTDEESRTPPRHERHIRALRSAAHLFALASEKEERLAFSSELARTTAMREDWCRTLVGELRSA